MPRWHLICLISALASIAHAGEILTSTGYRLCQDGGDLEIKTLEASFDRSSRVITFNVDGSSTKTQYVSAILTISAYGQQVYQNEFNPCDIHVQQLCPLPATSFSAQGNQTIPQAYVDMIPAIAYSVPDLDGIIKLQLLETSTKKAIGCIEASVTNGKTTKLPAIRYVSAVVAAVALLSTGLAAVMSGAHQGRSPLSPSFGETMGWFQTMAMNGMLSIDYPTIYRSFSSNFGFSTGLVTWPSLQQTIDHFRASTGGDLTKNNHDYIKRAALVFSGGRHLINRALLYTRDGIDGTDSSSHLVSGIQAYSEQLSIPETNTFMTLLLIFASVVAGLVLVVLLSKLILDVFTRAKPLPHVLESWRQRYWWRLSKAIINLVIIFYGVWTMYSIYQFTNGDSWAVKFLAATSFTLFTILLGGFIVRLINKANQLKRAHGDVDKLYEDKETWIRYSLFYGSFKRSYWWVFIPLIIGSCARGIIIAGANGHGFIQAIGHVAVDVALLVLLLRTRPYQSRSGNIINIMIQAVRVFSLACLLSFVEELGVNKTAKTIAGLALVIAQSALTGILAILLIVNAIFSCVRTGPQRRSRKQAEKLHHHDNSDDAQESLLMRDFGRSPVQAIVGQFDDQGGIYDPVHSRTLTPIHSRHPSDASYHSRDHSSESLLFDAADMGGQDHRASNLDA